VISCLSAAEPDSTRGVTGAFAEEFLHARWHICCSRSARIHTGVRRGEHFRVESVARSASIPLRRSCSTHDHGNAVGLFPGRARLDQMRQPTRSAHGGGAIVEQLVAQVSK